MNARRRCSQHPDGAGRRLRKRADLSRTGSARGFCGLTGIVWLHRKIQDAFFLVVGSRTCAHLIQSAAGVMIFAEPRFATAILDERDLAGIADIDDELDRVVDRLLERTARDQTALSRGLLPVRGDQNRPEARRRAAVTPSMRRAFAFSAIPAAASRPPLRKARTPVSQRLVRPCRSSAAETPKSLLVVGALADVVEDQFARLFAEMGSRPVHFLPMRRAADSPLSVPALRSLLAQPFLGDTARALEERGARRIAAPLPLGRRRHDAVAPRRSRRLRRSQLAFRSCHRPRARSRRQGPASGTGAAVRQADLLLSRFAARNPARALPRRVNWA